MIENATDILASISRIRSSLSNVSFSKNESVENLIRNIDFDNSTIYASGVGASALPSQVLAHSLASIGVTAVALDPLEVLHGGFGRIKKRDVIFCFSDSGRTQEIKKILGHARNQGIQTILVTRNQMGLTKNDTTHQINYSLNTENESVSGVPSTSLLSQVCISLSICDLISNMLGARMNSVTHPYGSLGLAHQKVVDFMQPINEDLLGNLHDNLHEVILKMSKNGLGILLFDLEDKGVGVFTDGDLRRLLAKTCMNSEKFNTPNDSDSFLLEEIQDFVNFSPKTLQAHDSLKDANTIFESGKKVLVAPVLKEKRIVGILHVHDILEKLQ